MRRIDLTVVASTVNVGNERVSSALEKPGTWVKSEVPRPLPPSPSLTATLAFFARSSACRHTLEPDLRRCRLSGFRVLCCAVQGNHLATFAPTELRSLLVEPRFDRTAGKISRVANTAHLVSVRSDLNHAVCPRSGAPANTDHDADNGSERSKSFHKGGHQPCQEEHCNSEPSGRRAKKAKAPRRKEPLASSIG